MKKPKKIKANKNVIWFFDFVFNQEYCVIFTPTHKKFCELAKKETGFDVEFCEGVSGEFHGLTGPRGGSLGLIWSSDKTHNLTHEMFHACAYTLRNRGIFLTEETEETYAYYLTFLLRTTNEMLKEEK
jgi:hypothetical protein